MNFQAYPGSGIITLFGWDYAFWVRLFYFRRPLVLVAPAGVFLFKQFILDF